MNFFRRLAELPPTIRFYRGRLWTDLVLRSALAFVGAVSVVIPNNESGAVVAGVPAGVVASRSDL